MGRIESEGIEKRQGPDNINLNALFCPNKCEVESFTIKVNRRPELVAAPYIYTIYCNGCGSIIVYVPKQISQPEAKDRPIHP